MQQWQKWTLGVLATVLSGLLVAGFVDYMRLRDEVQTMSRAGGYAGVFEVRADISELKSRVERLREQLSEDGRFTGRDGDRLRTEMMEQIRRVELQVEKLERRVDSLH